LPSVTTHSSRAAESIDRADRAAISCRRGSSPAYRISRQPGRPSGRRLTFPAASSNSHLSTHAAFEAARRSVSRVTCPARIRLLGHPHFFRPAQILPIERGAVDHHGDVRAARRVGLGRPTVSPPQRRRPPAHGRLAMSSQAISRSIGAYERTVALPSLQFRSAVASLPTRRGRVRGHTPGSDRPPCDQLFLPVRPDRTVRRRRHSSGCASRLRNPALPCVKSAPSAPDPLPRCPAGLWPTSSYDARSTSSGRTAALAAIRRALVGLSPPAILASVPRRHQRRRSSASSAKSVHGPATEGQRRLDALARVVREGCAGRDPACAAIGRPKRVAISGHRRLSSAMRRRRPRASGSAGSSAMSWSGTFSSSEGVAERDAECRATSVGDGKKPGKRRCRQGGIDHQ